MKKLAVIISVLVSSLCVMAQDQDAILSMLEENPSGDIAAKFSETRTSADKSSSRNLTGTLVYKTAGDLSMIYDDGEQFIIKGNTMKIYQNQVETVFDLTKNLMMKGLRNALIYSFQGKLQNLAVEQKADIKAVKEGKIYVVTLTAQKKAVRGYSRIEIRYNSSDCAIVSMLMEEFSGAVTKYSL